MEYTNENGGLANRAAESLGPLWETSLESQRGTMRRSNGEHLAGATALKTAVPQPAS